MTRKYRLSTALDVDDLLMECTEYAIQLANEDYQFDPPMTIYETIEKWNGRYNGKNKLDTLRQMGETLKQMQEATSELYAIIQNERKVALGNRKADLEDAAGKVYLEAEGRKKKEQMESYEKNYLN